MKEIISEQELNELKVEVEQAILKDETFTYDYLYDILIKITEKRIKKTKIKENIINLKVLNTISEYLFNNQNYYYTNYYKMFLNESNRLYNIYLVILNHFKEQSINLDMNENANLIVDLRLLEVYIIEHLDNLDMYYMNAFLNKKNESKSSNDLEIYYNTFISKYFKEPEERIRLF